MQKQPAWQKPWAVPVIYKFRLRERIWQNEKSKGK